MESLGRILKVPRGISRGRSPREIPRGTFNIRPRDSIEYRGGFPRDSIHHETPKGLSQIIIITMYWTSSRGRDRCTRPVLVLATGARAESRAERPTRQWRFGCSAPAVTSTKWCSFADNIMEEFKSIILVLYIVIMNFLIFDWNVSLCD